MVVFDIDYRPTVSSDELTLYTGYMGVRMTRRTTTDEPFSDEVRLDNLNGDFATWISPDDCRIYFERDAYIFVASRPLP